ncbi:MAG: hypothetical protein IJW92_00060 [Clostridia bacterium]|nr:hypothetical protein [Clostridia bacterium]
MYSRYQYRPEKRIQIPDHYSGCAFSARQRGEEPMPHYPEVSRPTPRESTEEPAALPLPPPVLLPSRPEEEEIHKPTSPDEEEPSCDESKHTQKEELHEQKKHSELPEPLKNLLGNMHIGKRMSFADGLDFDQLLILGLILLLANSEQDSDIVLWLGLLLLCG